jgi:16S rRNA (cytidine1402-2'-O)-methyltransferase
MASGMLYVVGTPIGNLEDITLRALRILKSVALIACEDTRHTQKLLNHYEISTKTESYHKFSEKSKCGHFIELLQGGRDIALVSDSGMPGISDPGTILIQEAIRSNIRIVPVPGPSAAITALVVSGFDTTHFFFEGFLPQKTMAKKKRLSELASERSPIILYESPKRAPETVKCIQEVMGARSIVIARELTKFYEEVLRGAAPEVLLKIEDTDIKGEVVVIVEGCAAGEEKPADIEGEIKETMQKLNLSKKEAIVFVAKRYNLQKKEVYRKTIGCPRTL